MKDKKKKHGIGLKYAINGINEAFRRERNFRIHLFIACLVIICGFLFRLALLEWIIIILLIQFVLMTELINSIVERIIDYVKPDYHLQAKIIKDISAAVVLIAAITSVVIGAMIFIPKLMTLLAG